jgi:hypothetical protein
MISQRRTKRSGGAPASGRLRARSWQRLCSAGLLLTLWLPMVSRGAVNVIEDLQVTSSFSADTAVTPDSSFELLLSRELREGEGRIAIIIGRTDVSSLFVQDGVRLTYVPNLVPLPLGKPNVVVYQVSMDGEWQELARFTIQVVKEAPAATPATAPLAAPPALSPTESLPSNPARIATSVKEDPQIVNGVAALVQPGETTSKAETNSVSQNVPAGASSAAPATQSATNEKKMKFTPSVTIAVKSQMAQFNFPENTRPTERATFTDGTVQFSLRSEGTAGPLSSQTQFDFAGSTFQPEALRFGTLGANAPQIDMSSYLAQFQLGPAKVAVGHTSFGSARHLINSFSSRGITVTVPITKRFDFSVGALNGTNVVGYGNFFGLGKTKHQLQSATVGVELLPKRPGGLRLEVSGVRAYIQGLNSFSQGSVNDVERSKGGSVRLIATDKSGRFKFEGGFTRSQYRNPADPLLYQGTNTVPVPLLTRNAHYIDVSADVLRSYSLTKSKQLSLSLAFRHEQVDPLYKSLGASAQADKYQNDFQVSGNLGEISFQAGHGRFNDNLKHIASILQSLTRSKQYSVALPAAALWGATSSTSSKLLPRLSYSRSDNHQFGAAIPVNGGFETDPGSVPNQYSTNHSFSADWQFQKVNVGSSYNRSFTNNQQLGRERSDFLSQTTTARVGFNPTSSLNLNFDLNRDSSNDLESVKLVRTWRVGTTGSWNIGKHISWTAGIANTIAGDREQTNGSRNTEFETQFSYRKAMERGGLRKVQTQMFIRYADRYARSRDLIFQTSNLTRVKIVNAGLNVTFF